MPLLLLLPFWLSFSKRKRRNLLSINPSLHSAYAIQENFFELFGPEIACQVRKTPKSFPINNIHVAF
jgi:hypothetical protein